MMTGSSPLSVGILLAMASLVSPGRAGSSIVTGQCGTAVCVSGGGSSAVCGFDSITGFFRAFPDRCSMLQENQCYGSGWSIAHAGPCTPGELDSYCRPDQQPVCGQSPTAGYKTFINICYLALVSSSVGGGDYVLAHNGRCSVPDGPVPGCPIILTNAVNPQPICAFSKSFKNFTTFQNHQQFFVLNRCSFDNDYILVHPGACTRQELGNDCSRRPSSVAVSGLGLVQQICTVSPTLGYKTYFSTEDYIYDLICNSVDYTLSHTGRCSVPDGPVPGCPVVLINAVTQPICAMSKSTGIFTSILNQLQLPGLNRCNYDNDYIFVHSGVCTTQELGIDCSRGPPSVAVSGLGLAPICTVSPTLGYKTYSSLPFYNYDLICNAVDYKLSHTGQCSVPDGPVPGCPVVLINAVTQPICAMSKSTGIFTSILNQLQLPGLNRCNYDNDYIFVHSGVCTTQELGIDCSRGPPLVAVSGLGLAPICTVSPTLGYKTYSSLALYSYDLICNAVDYKLSHTGQCSVPDGPVPGCPVVLTNTVNQPMCAFSKSTRLFTSILNQPQFPSLNRCNYDNDYIFVHPGVCTTQELGNDCSRGPPSVPVSGSGLAQICTVSRTLGFKTYPSLAFYVYDLTCNAVDYTLTHTGRCSTPDGPIPGCPISSSPNYNPVCAYSQFTKTFSTFHNQQKLDSQNICTYDNDYLFSHIGVCTGDETLNNCQRSCFQSYQPICGVSPTLGYKTYGNRCFFFLDLSCANTDYSFAHSGKCRVPDGPVGGCPASYPQVFNPKCAFSFSTKTFKNFLSKFQLDAENRCIYDNDYVIVHDGPCTTDETGNLCGRGCPRTFQPVCGLSPTSGQKTFGNICLFVLDLTCNGGDYTFSNDGKCSNDGSSNGGCPVSCSSTPPKPLCGFSPSRGYNTFSSPCRWQAENTCYNGDFNFAHYGDCSRDELEKKCHQQNCPVDYNPICAFSQGQGYKTFPSTCEFETFNKCRGPTDDVADYSLSHNGKCTPKELGGSCNHDCPLVYEGICGKGSFGYKTFANECFMDRENSCTKSDYSIAHRGKCTVSETGKKCNRVCKYIYTPVCAKSKSKKYKTFANFCLMDRDNSCFNQDYVVAHQGECFPNELCVNCNI